MFRRGRQELVERIESLVTSDPDRAAEELAANRKRLSPPDAGRLSGLVRSKLHARDQVEYLTRGLADNSISATAGCELLSAYLDAGYVDQEEFANLRRSAFEAHRREVLRLLADETAGAGDYFRQLDGYRSAGYLSEDGVLALEQLVDGKLNPAKAASRLFAEARVALDAQEQESLLLRYLMEFEGFPEYGPAASDYIALKIDQLWRFLPSVQHARAATVAINELNSLLVAYLPYTNDISLSVPIDQVFGDFMALASEFKPEPDMAGRITVRHLRQRVVVASHNAAEPGTYEAERNDLIDVGTEGRVMAVRPDRVMLSIPARSLMYSRVWPQAEFEGSQYSHVHPGASLSAWDQDEVGLLNDSRPSPVFVHQYREAVKRMSDLLEQHREDRSGSPTPIADRVGQAF